MINAHRNTYSRYFYGQVFDAQYFVWGFVNVLQNINNCLLVLSFNDLITYLNYRLKKLDLAQLFLPVKGNNHTLLKVMGIFFTDY